MPDASIFMFSTGPHIVIIWSRFWDTMHSCYAQHIRFSDFFFFECLANSFPTEMYSVVGCLLVCLVGFSCLFICHFVNKWNYYNSLCTNRNCLSTFIDAIFYECFGGFFLLLAALLCLVKVKGVLSFAFQTFRGNKSIQKISTLSSFWMALA